MELIRTGNQQKNLGRVGLLISLCMRPSSSIKVWWDVWRLMIDELYFEMTFANCESSLLIRYHRPNILRCCAGIRHNNELHQLVQRGKRRALICSFACGLQVFQSNKTLSREPNCILETQHCRPDKSYIKKQHKYTIMCHIPLENIKRVWWYEKPDSAQAYHLPQRGRKWDKHAKKKPHAGGTYGCLWCCRS